MYEFIALLSLFAIPVTVAAILLVFQELVHWVRNKKLAQISILPIILCPLAGLAYGTRLAVPVVIVMMLCTLPVIRVLLGFQMKTPLGYWMILVPAATVCLAELVGIVLAIH